MNQPSNAPALPAYPSLLGEVCPLTSEELEHSLHTSLQHWDRTSDLWLFAYGSLIWKPDLPAAESCNARVYGYHRGLYLWSCLTRGTPQIPGLVLALDRGGSCAGHALRIATDGAMTYLEKLWQREMAMGSYRPVWLACQLNDGRRVRALTFAMQRDKPTYAGRLPDHIVSAAFERAQGHCGTTLDYVARTVEALRASGIPDRTLEALLKRCQCKKAEE